MLEVRTHVLVPYDDLKLCRKLEETFSLTMSLSNLSRRNHHFLNLWK